MFPTLALLSALKGNNLQRWSDPRLSCLAVEAVSCAVIFYGVAVHRELPGTRCFGNRTLPLATARA